MIHRISRRKILGATMVTAGAVLTLPKTKVHSQTVLADAPYGLQIPSEFPYEKKRVRVNGSEMAYVDEGTGPVVLFLHGNPTSSYLWRNIIPHVVGDYRAVAPDLIGMGDSAKPDIDYTFEDHATYLDGFIEALGLTEITLVVHDWGSALGMRYARLNPDNVRAMAYMEAIVPPSMPVPNYEAMGQTGELFRALRTPGQGETMVLDRNFFIEEVLPKFGVSRPLSEAEMDAYRAPYQTRESRLPTLQWPREIPIGGKPKATHDAVIANGDWLYSSAIPKLLFYATPGVLTPEPVVDHMAKNVSNLEVRFLGRGLHFLQEDHPDQIGLGIRDWLGRI